MVVPPQTKVRLHSERYVRKILFENKFVEFCITFKRRAGSRGLGDYQLLLGYDRRKNDTFWSEHLEITCHADFNKLRSGHPEMGRYRRWVHTMFSELEYRLDDKQRMERTLEYKSLFSTLSRKVLHRGDFSSTEDLEDKIIEFITYYNEVLAKPYKWTYIGKSLAKAS